MLNLTSELTKVALVKEAITVEGNRLPHFNGNFAPENPRAHSWPYIRKSLKSKLLHQKTPQHTIDQIYENIKLFSRMCAGGNTAVFRADMAGLNRIWPKLSEMIRKNRGLAQFMLDYGCHSRFFAPFIANVPRPITLDTGHGWTYDLAGNFTKIPMPGDGIYDSAAYFSTCETIFSHNRLRCREAQKLMKDAERVLFIGGGLLPELRFNNYKPLVKQEIVVYDLDDGNLQDFPVVFGKTLEEYNATNDMGITIDYRIDDYRNALHDFALWGHSFDLVVINGVLSYYPDKKTLQETLTYVSEFLKHNGKLIFDLQTMEESLIRDALTLGWKTEPMLKPERSVLAAMNKITAVTESLHDVYAKPFKVIYDEKPYNVSGKPAGAIFIANRL